MYGKEYFFGGGLQSMPHEQFVQMHGGVRPAEYIEMGSTDIPQVWNDRRKLFVRTRRTF